MVVPPRVTGRVGITILPFSEPKSFKMGGDAWESPFCHFSEPKSSKMVIPRVAGRVGITILPFANLVGMRTYAKFPGMRTPLHTSTYC